MLQYHDKPMHNVFLFFFLNKKQNNIKVSIFLTFEDSTF